MNYWTLKKNIEPTTSVMNQSDFLRIKVPEYEKLISLSRFADMVGLSRSELLRDALKLPGFPLHRPGVVYGIKRSELCRYVYENPHGIAWREKLISGGKWCEPDWGQFGRRYLYERESCDVAVLHER